MGEVNNYDGSGYRGGEHIEDVNTYMGIYGKEITGSPNDIFKILKDKVINRYEGGYNMSDLGLIEEAYKFASDYHGTQKRASGEPFIVHPLNVAITLVDYGMSAEVIAAGLLHDVLEDTEATSPKLIEFFGEKITDLVEGVSKTTEIKTRNPNLSGMEIIKLFSSAIKNIEVLIIKLADRLHNIRTLQYIQKHSKRERIAKETLSIYAKLAGRLGIGSIKRELEDRAFFFLSPKEWRWIADIYMEKAKKYREHLSLAKSTLQKKLEDKGISAKIQTRTKHIYSIYQKIKEKNRDLKDIYDYLGIRIITNDVSNCYLSLGIVHSLWKPLQGRMKDHIASPKKNGYQSLHTTIIGPNSTQIEVQIRTCEMHKTAEYGLAAHWRYKEEMNKSMEKYTKKVQTFWN